ncbi:hypothetical protein BV25DRAFT_1993355 [Artomyces pyxidatus]|uniref:Uncharacterized protein n=1 Tax=Artomyces pyxidatus TaxID=48021 RepID=A0ACB8SVP0_9AGAM|nr:hypothetical protein BV25DRAFT_1993355 [Artomyces pyxidatus]
MLDSESRPPSPDSKPSNKRTRKILNCEPCRSSKLKCDRNRPCSSCVLRGHASLCYSVDDKDNASTSPSENQPSAPPEPVTSTVNTNSEFRKIRQSLSLLESHVSHLQSSTQSETSSNSTETRAQRVDRKPPPPPPPPIVLKRPVWSPRSNLGVGPTSWISYLGFKSFPDAAESSDKALPPDILRARYERDNDLIAQLPALAVIDGLIDFYFEHCNWIHRYVNEPSFTLRWQRYKAGERPCRVTLATVCVVIAVALHHLPEVHELLEGLPAPRDELTGRCYNIMRTVMARQLWDSSHYNLDYVELFLIRGHYLSLATVDSEEIWHVKGELVTVGLALGLHRESGNWGLLDVVVERRRWAWWHIVFFERWHAFVFGRPLTLSSQHFDTQFPSTGDMTGDKTPRVFTAHLALFRLGHLIGEFMDDATSLRPVPYGNILDMDRLLQQWLDGLPTELNLDDLSLIRSIVSPITSIRKLGVQSLFLRATFLHVRFALHKAHASGSLRGDSPEMSTSMNIAIDAADKLMTLVLHVRPESLGGVAVGVLTHLSAFPFHMFSAAMFLAFLVADNPDKAAFQPFRASVARAVAGLARLKGRAFADKGLAVLQALDPLYSESFLHDSLQERARKRGDALLRVQAIALPSRGPGGDASDVVYDASMSSSPASSGPWDQNMMQPQEPPGAAPLPSSMSPSLPWASVGIRNVLNPYAPRKRMRSQSDIPQTASYSAPPTPQTELTSSFIVPSSTNAHNTWRRPSNATVALAHTYSTHAPSTSHQHLTSFVQEEAEGTYKIASADKESLWGASIGFDKGELGQFFEDMEDGTT